MKRSFSVFNSQFSLAALLGCGLQAVGAQPVKDERPNIILIMVDDLGFSDLGAYGAGDIQTPNIDRLAQEGVRFRQFYNNAISAPTRASLITGQYQHRAGVGFFNVNLGLPAYQGFLNRESLTFAEVLKGAGYSTLMSGKWHVGDDKDQWPNQRGFDRFFGFIGGASSYYQDPTGKDPLVLFKNNEPVHPAPDKYLTEAIADHALEFLDEQNGENKPFFLYLAFNAPHWPLQAPEEDVARYRDVYAAGWDSLRNVRYRNSIEKGVTLPGQQMAARDASVPLWNRLTYDEQQFWQRRQEVYAAMIDRTDREIGRVLNKLKELGKDDNTLVVFISDNGAQGGEGLYAYTRRTSGTVGSAGSYELQNSNWSQTGNSPLRNYKGRPYEGGISSPFIAWFPKKVKAGGIVDGTGHIIDLAPTFYELAGAQYPASFNGATVHPLPGKSLVPVLTGATNKVERGEPLFWERAGNKAVRSGKWKLVSLYPENRYELYDIEADRAENRDLAAQHPDIVERLKNEYAQWAAKNDVTDYSILAGSDPFAQPSSRNAKRSR
ncbi:MAG: sulfatase-like hydrolase/transferase [Bacteroidales bacterium]|jgi:arylsulfatase|nr:sulfatase-like hydrolase/transferase [Bacteroidales bacterium]